MNRIKALWGRSASGKLLVILGGLIVLCCACIGLGLLLPRSPQPASAPAAQLAPASAVTIVARATSVPTETPVPPTPTAPPSATAEPTIAPTLAPVDSPVPPTQVPPATAPPAAPVPTDTPKLPVVTAGPTRDARNPGYQWNWGSGTQNGSTCVCGGPDLNCADFASWTEAQACFDKCGGSPSKNVFQLDQNHNGIVCEKPK